MFLANMAKFPFNTLATAEAPGDHLLMRSYAELGGVDIKLA
jgi:hypothetical protein